MTASSDGGARAWSCSKSATTGSNDTRYELGQVRRKSGKNPQELPVKTGQPAPKESILGHMTAARELLTTVTNRHIVACASAIVSARHVRVRPGCGISHAKFVGVHPIRG